eukprot:TRINITY_DN6370_c0_g1_i1.p1 TRINITY_DN6370_c0_g1~~TRINITY_DN6370_c0_g1_i1.p1  ORF type:complete len:278 (-),score=57.84 TRINITY_DN6370_c0_g1_i1:212-1045(-)
MVQISKRLVLTFLFVTGLCFIVGFKVGSSHGPQALRGNPKKVDKDSISLESTGEHVEPGSRGGGLAKVSHQLGGLDPTYGFGTTKDEWRQQHLLMVAGLSKETNVETEEDMKFVRWEVTEGQTVAVNDRMLLGRANGIFVEVRASAPGRAHLTLGAKMKPGDVIAKGTVIASIGAPAVRTSPAPMTMVIVMLICAIVAFVTGTWWSFSQEDDANPAAEERPKPIDRPVERYQELSLLPSDPSSPGGRLLKKNENGEAVMPGMPTIGHAAVASAAQAK